MFVNRESKPRGGIIIIQLTVHSNTRPTQYVVPSEADQKAYIKINWFAVVFGGFFRLCSP